MLNQRDESAWKIDFLRKPHADGVLIYRKAWLKLKLKRVGLHQSEESFRGQKIVERWVNLLSQAKREMWLRGKPNLAF